MSRAVSSFAPEVPAWSRSFEEFGTIFQQLTHRLRTLDQQLQDTTAELSNETEIRKNWMKRANEAESRLKQQQFVLMLVDGNQTFFKTEAIQAANPEAAVQSLVAEVLATAQHQHRNDLTADIRVLTHVFVDLKRLADDFVASELLSSPQELYEFTHTATASQALLSLVDCGPGREGVDAKMKDYYELFIENVQCRHIILALGADSEYYSTLDMYSEDAYTLSKTSLVKNSSGLPTKFNLPFHQIDFLSIEAVPLSPLVQLEAKEATESRTPKDANFVASSAQASVPTHSADASASSQHSLQNHSSSSSQPPPSGGSDPRRLAPSSQTSHHSASQAGNLSARGSSETSPPDPVVGYPPPPSTCEETSASYEHDWERNAGSYMPPSCTTPWGFEKNASEKVEDPSDTSRTEVQRPPRKNNAPAQRRDPPRKSWTDENSTSQIFSATTEIGARRTAPASFKGHWDDLSSSPTAEGPQSPSLRLSASRTRPAASNPGDMALNKFGERVDLPLPPSSSDDKSRLLARSKDRKLCNEHHLKRGCHNDKCRYDHEPADSGLLLALRHLARTQPCLVGRDCRMPECPYGHHCPHAGGKHCKNLQCSMNRKKGLPHLRELEVAEIILSSKT